MTLAVRTSTELARPGVPLADELAAHLRAQLGDVRVDGQPRNRLDLIGEACEPDTARAVVAWLSTGRRGSVNTRRAYADDIRAWAAFARELGHARLDLAALTTDQVTAWRLAQEARGVSARTVARRLSALSSLYGHAARHGRPQLTNPVDPDDHRPIIDRHDRVSATPVLELADVRALIGAADDLRDVVLVCLLYVLAGRVSELCAADVTDRLDGGRRLRVTRKGDKHRVLVLPLPVADLLDAYLDGRAEGPLLLDHDGDRIARHDITRVLARLGRRAGVLPERTLTPHVLRASRITHLIDAGVPLTEVQAYADHDDPATTLGYVERRAADARNETLASTGADALNGLLDTWLRGSRR